MATLTDVHSPEECAAAGAVVDVLQIPAFLCRQSSLLKAAGAAGRAVNVKKGQFLAPADMAHAAAKVAAAGCDHILFTERGSFFGYRDLVVDFRSVKIMRELGRPVVFDATHSVQTPGSTGTTTGGLPALIPTARALRRGRGRGRRLPRGASGTGARPLRRRQPVAAGELRAADRAPWRELRDIVREEEGAA